MVTATMGAAGAALLAGLLGSPHCAAMCGGFATACGRGGRGDLLRWHAGRLTTYALLGALAGAFGAVIPGPAWLPAALSALLLGWFALALAGLAPEPAPRAAWVGRAGARLLRRAGPGATFAFGLLNGLLPCGMVYAALAVPIALAHPLGGALAMLAFGAGTVPALALLSGAVRRLAARGLWPRRVLAALVLLVGLWSIGLRVGLAPGAPRSSPHAAHAHPR